MLVVSGLEYLFTTHKTKNNMEFIMIDAALFDSLLEKLNKLADEANKIRNNEKDAILEQWLDGQEVCEILGVTKRTLQTLRETGKIAYAINSFMKHTRMDQSDERVNSLMKTIETLSSTLSEIRKSTMRRPLNNEFYLTDKELSVGLKVSRRTLQEWRYSGQISYFRIGGKMVFERTIFRLFLTKVFVVHLDKHSVYRK